MVGLGLRLDSVVIAFAAADDELRTGEGFQVDELAVTIIEVFSLD
nr:hypothetical protein [Natrinema sp. CBA1119]